MKTIELDGSFEVTGDNLVVTDPCYDRGTWCQGIVTNVRRGTWRARLDVLSSSETSWGERVAAIEAFAPETGGPWEKLPFEVGVDSGQAGVFDEPRYPHGDTGDYGEPGTFYGRACSRTMSENEEPVHGGLIDEGAVCRSGYGDGGYSAYASRAPDGTIVAVRIVFIDEEEE